MTNTRIDIHLEPAEAGRALRVDALAGLTAEPKWLPPKWFYDARGSELFEEITRLAEYYPTRAERQILDLRAIDIAKRTDVTSLVELGSGSSEKTRLLLDALRDHGTLKELVCLDVSASALDEAVGALTDAYPSVTVQGVVADFTEHLGRLNASSPRLVAFMGGTIGNLLPAERANFFESVRGVLDRDGWLLLGADLVKAPQTLVTAYDDAKGVTAEFNRNVLHVLNRELGANFDVEAFEHRAAWDADAEWIEMHLVATRDMVVEVPALDLVVTFAAGESMRTEISAKFRREGLEGELRRAGFEPDFWWTDDEERFAVVLARSV